MNKIRPLPNVLYSIIKTKRRGYNTGRYPEIIKEFFGYKAADFLKRYEETQQEIENEIGRYGLKRGEYINGEQMGVPLSICIPQIFPTKKWIQTKYLNLLLHSYFGVCPELEGVINIRKWREKLSPNLVINGFTINGNYWFSFSTNTLLQNKGNVETTSIPKGYLNIFKAPFLKSELYDMLRPLSPLEWVWYKDRNGDEFLVDFQTTIGVVKDTKKNTVWLKLPAFEKKEKVVYPFEYDRAITLSKNDIVECIIIRILDTDKNMILRKVEMLTKGDSFNVISYILTLKLWKNYLLNKGILACREEEFKKTFIEACDIASKFLKMSKAELIETNMQKELLIKSIEPYFSIVDGNVYYYHPIIYHFGLNKIELPIFQEFCEMIANGGSWCKEGLRIIDSVKRAGDFFNFHRQLSFFKHIKRITRGIK